MSSPVSKSFKSTKRTSPRVNLIKAGKLVASGLKYDHPQIVEICDAIQSMKDEIIHLGRQLVNQRRADRMGGDVQPRAPRVLVTVLGGAVNLISADSPILVNVKDWDNIEAGGEFDPTDFSEAFTVSPEHLDASARHGIKSTPAPSQPTQSPDEDPERWDTSAE